MRASLPPPPNRVRSLIIIVLLSTGLVAGCGLKDDLYLPPPEAPAPPAQESDNESEASSAARP